MKENSLDISNLRQNYKRSFLLEKDIYQNPFTQFEQWFKEALDAQILEPNAFSLATSTHDGFPSVRIVLLKEITSEGLVFFTNYNSKKGKELTTNPKCSLVFFWGELERQVRIQGVATKLTKHESFAYFKSRPKESQIGATISPQSEIIPSREYLDNLFVTSTDKYKDIRLPLPDHWGGFIIKPINFEFWQGRENRLHDRIMYQLMPHTNDWQIIRLAP
jgi:pyridoxamine 5'-phosphate oxidase